MKKPEIVACRYDKGELYLKWKPVELATSYGIFIKNKNGDFRLIDKVHYMKTIYKKKIKLKNSSIVIKGFNHSKFNKLESAFSNQVVINREGIVKFYEK